MGKLKTFGVNFTETAAMGGGVKFCNFSIPTQNGAYYVRRLIWDWNAVVNDKLLNRYNQGSSELFFTLQAANAIPLNTPVIVNAPTPQQDPTSLQFYTPGIYIFESLFVENNLNGGFTIINRDPLANCIFKTAFIIEIETI
jgi:hypothetical protein